MLRKVNNPKAKRRKLKDIKKEQQEKKRTKMQEAITNTKRSGANN